MLRCLAVFLTGLVLSACSTAQKSSVAITPVSGEPQLTQAMAEVRSHDIEKLSYEQKFVLSSGESYSGEVRINFDYRGEGKNPLPIDFAGGRVLDLKLNGKNAAFNYDGQRILVAASELKPGPQSLEIRFTGNYVRNGQGLFKFVDAEDKKTYLYTDLEPYYANQVFPCFDQPDLKATFKIQVIAPSNWVVVTATPETGKADAGQGQTLWSFQETLPLATYFWSLHAGEYKVWSSNYFRIPLRLMSRASLAKYVKPEAWFQIVKQGLQFYEKYFAQSYPYPKLDNLIVPEYNHGAMENAGAITFSERFVRKGEPSEKEKRDMADTILHETAHMWFGDLVTMRWWNGLWLNESFATYMAALSMSEATSFKNAAWRDFNGLKSWAYWTDQNVATHPIEMPSPTTRDAFVNFDGITYAKGASWIKQAQHFIGPDAFRDGIRIYISKHKGGNTDLADFVGALSEGAKTDLSEWSRVWLQTSGLNSVDADWSCDKGTLKTLTLKQAYQEDHAVYRPQKIKVALYAQQKAGLTRYADVDALLQGEVTEAKWTGNLKCPEFVFSNADDHAYLRVKFSEKNMLALGKGPLPLTSAFDRQLVWQSLWEMFRDGDYPYQAMGERVIASLATETDDIIISRLTEYLHGRENNRPSVLFYWPRETPEQIKSFNDFARRAEQTVFNRIGKVKPGSEIRKLLVESFIKMVETPVGIAELGKMLDGTSPIKDVAQDQDRRWQILQQLASHGDPQIESRLKTELLRDKTSEGIENSLRVQASIPSSKGKLKWNQEVLDQNSKLTFQQKTAVMEGLYPRNQRNFRREMATDFFKNLDSLRRTADSMYLGAYLDLAPDECDSQQLQMISEYVNKSKELPPVIERELRIRRHEGERCIRIQASGKKP